MSINPEKTEAIIFTRRRMILPPLVRVNDYSVPWSKTVKYLGAVLDSGLRYGPDRVRRALGAFCSLYPLLNRKSALPVKYKILLYKMCAKPASLYAGPVWGYRGTTYLSKPCAKTPK